MQTEQQLQAQGYESTWQWSLNPQLGGEIRQANWSDGSGRFSFYCKGVPIITPTTTTTPTAATADLSAQYANVFAVLKEAAVQGDPNMHKTLNFPSAQHEQAFLQIVNQGQFKLLPARWCTKDLGIKYCQRWSQDSQDGRYKAGDFVIDAITQQPRIYTQIRAAVLCDFNGQPIEDPLRQCRNKLNSNLKPNELGIAQYVLAEAAIGPQGGNPSNPLNQQTQAAYNASGQPVNLGAPITGQFTQQVPPVQPTQPPGIVNPQGFVVNQMQP